MKKNLKVLLYLILFTLNACNKDDSSKIEVFTLNSIPSKGFIFSDLRIINFPNSSNIKPDFLVLAQINQVGEVIAPCLTNPDLENRFLLLKEFDNSASALLYFDSCVIPADKPLEQSAFGIKSNQIWLIKTNEGDFGKLLILESRVDIIEQNTPFAEVKFKASKMH